MKLEDQCCGLQYSKRLNELGVKQESLFLWNNIDTHYPRIVPSHYELERSGDYAIPAFTVSELGEMVPNRVIVAGAEPFDNFRVCCIVTKSQ